jgi:hypothetical protein
MECPLNRRKADDSYRSDGMAATTRGGEEASAWRVHLRIEGDLLARGIPAAASLQAAGGSSNPTS